VRKMTIELPAVANLFPTEAILAVRTYRQYHAGAFNSGGSWASPCSQIQARGDYPCEELVIL
jgi:hypothetical protein